MFEFVLFFVIYVFLCCMIIVITFAPLSLPSLGSLVSSMPDQRDVEMLVWFHELCVAAFCSSFVFFYVLAFRLVLSCRPPSPIHIVRRIVPLRTGTAVHVIFCLLSSIDTFIVACFVTTDWISKR